LLDLILILLCYCILAESGTGNSQQDS